MNATGPAGLGGLEHLTDEQWWETIDLGAMGMVRCVRAAIPLLRRADWARIVNVSAHSTKRQSPDIVAYTRSLTWIRVLPRGASCPVR